MDEVAGLLGEFRLVTVTGPGGVGKTRLAGEVAQRVAGRFADGVWLVELAAVQEPELVAAEVAAVLGVRELPGEPVAESLAAVLVHQQLLLVLDNCEHVLGAAAELCGALLPAADDVRVLATSREPVGVAGEARYRLPPLTLPGPDDPAGAGGCEAVALFADRARSADVHFALDGETGPAVARLVARLDGMPLAIELAAARVEALGVAQLLDRLDDRFGLLTAGDRLAAARQRSLVATVEWSYRLLDEQEQRVFRQVSVFPASFTLEGADAVAGPGAGPTVLRLVDCSLLVPPRAGADGRPRYVMLETLRAYAAGLLAEAGEQDGAVAALAGYALRVAEEAAAELQTRTRELAAVRRLDAEDATMVQVLAWAMQHDAAVCLRLAVALGWWWFLRGRLAGQYPLLREAAGRAAVGSDGWCAAQFWLGWTAVYSADLAGALGHFTVLRDAVGDWGPSRALADGLAGRSNDIGEHGPVRRGDRRWPPLAGRGPGGWLFSRRGAGRSGPQPRRSFRRQPRRRHPAGPAGRADPGGRPWLASPGVQLRLDVGADRGRGPGHRRARLRGGAGPVPGRGRPVEPSDLSDADGDPGLAGGPRRGRCGAPAGRTSDRLAGGAGWT